MNIFVLDQNPVTAAQQHCDRHVVKMIIEYAQLLSTAHRVLDGVEKIIEYQDMRLNNGVLKPQNHSKKFWVMPGEVVTTGPEIVGLDIACKLPAEQRKVVVATGSPYYWASHIKHPAGIWVRQSTGNYHFLCTLFQALCKEYTHRYGRTHATERKLSEALTYLPKNIQYDDMTPLPQAMPEKYKVVNDAVAAYQNYYVGEKTRFAVWTNRAAPQWFVERTQNYDKTNFERTRIMA